MKSLKQLSFIGIALALIFSSCTMEKRVYRQGLHVEWSKQKSKKQNDHLNTEANEHADKNYLNKNENLVASSDISTPIIIGNNKILLVDTCDMIIFKSGGQAIRGKVVDIGVSEIKYKKCDNVSGPTITINKSDVYMIMYANGTKDVFEEKKTVVEDSETELNDEDSEILNDDFKLSKSNGNSKSDKPKRVSALAVLSFIFGLLGIAALIVALGYRYANIGAIFFFLFYLLTLLFGSAGLSKIINNKGKYTGLAWAIVGLSFAFIMLIVFLMNLSHIMDALQ